MIDKKNVKNIEDSLWETIMLIQLAAVLTK